MSIVINPGSGPVQGASCEQAADNMKHFVVDLGVEDLKVVPVPEKDYGDGRYCFLVYRDGGTRYHEVQMPGLPLQQVRFVSSPEQNIWDYPRLYVDGSSWVWEYAVSGLSAEEDWEEPEESDL